MESILTSIKKQLGIEEEYIHFDQEIIMCINTAFTILTQLGVGPTEGFSINDSKPVWTDFMPDIDRIEAIKSYVYLKVKLFFDPPVGSAVMESSNRMLSELEWRINVAAENGIKQG